MKSLFEELSYLLRNFGENYINLNIPCPPECNPENWVNIIEATGDYFENRHSILASSWYPYRKVSAEGALRTSCSCYEQEAKCLLDILKHTPVFQINLHVYESDKEL